MSLIAAGGAVAWGIVVSHPYEPRMRAIAALTLAVPLVNTWPARAWVAIIDGAPGPVQALFAPSTLLLAAIVVLAPRRRYAPSAQRYALAAVAVVAAAALASLLADDPGDALAATFHTHAVPVAFALAVAASVRTARDGWLLIQLAAIGAAIPAAVGVAAYIVSFGLPLSASDLIDAKVALVRPHLFQELTFGNVGHLADLVLLTLPAAILGSVRPEAARWLQVASGLATAAIAGALLLTASRGAMAIAAAELTFIAGLLLVSCRLRWALAPATVLVAVVAVALSPEVRGTYSELIPSVDRGTEPGAAIGELTFTDESATDRINALKAGVRITADNLPFGIGIGQYRAYDEVYTAPHSLLVLLLAEAGIVGGLAFLAVVALLLADGVRGLRPERRAIHDLFLLRTACLVGALGFLLHGLVSGAPLAVGQVNVWAAVFWLEVGVVASLRKSPDRAE